MTAATPSVVHAVPGRLRVHAPHWAQAPPARLDQWLRSLPGVERVSASATTGNVLVRFDPSRLADDRILAALGAADGHAAPAVGGPESGGAREAEPSAPTAIVA